MDISNDTIVSILGLFLGIFAGLKQLETQNKHAIAEECNMEQFKIV